MPEKTFDLERHVTEGDNQQTVLLMFRSMVKSRLNTIKPKIEEIPNTFLEWIVGRALHQNMYAYRHDVSEPLSWDLEKSVQTGKGELSWSPDLYNSRSVTQEYTEGRHFSLQCGIKTYRPNIIHKDTSLYVDAEQCFNASINFYLSCAIEEELSFNRKHLKTKLEALEELYQSIKASYLGPFVLYGTAIPEEFLIPKELHTACVVFRQILSSLYLHEIPTEDNEFPEPLKFTRYLTRKLQIQDDIFTSWVSENIDCALEFIKGEAVEVSFLNNKGLVEFYKDPMGINSCMTGKDRQYCVDSYNLNPNCGLAVFKKRGVVRARSLVYLTDAGVKIHCNVYSVGNISGDDCRGALKEKGFTDIRALYGFVDGYMGRISKAFLRRDFFAISNSFSRWLDNNPLPEDCKTEAQVFLDPEKNKCNNEVMPEFFEWVKKWFTLTFVTNEDGNIPFLDSFGMWKIIKKGKNLQLEALPLRNNLNNPEWSDLRTAAGPGRTYKTGSNTDKSCLLFDTAEELKAANVPPRYGYSVANPGWLYCAWRNKWFNPDVWGYKNIEYRNEKGIVEHGQCMSQYYSKFRPGRVYIYNQKTLMEYWAHKLTYVEPLDIYLHGNNIDALVSYNKEKSFRDNAGMVTITDPDVVVFGLNDPPVSEDAPQLSNSKTFEDLQFIEVVDLRSKKKAAV